MAATKTLLTADEFFQLRGGEGKMELVRGEVVEMAPVGGAHGGCALEFGWRMRTAARRTHLGFVLVETGYRLRRNPDTVRAPDVSFVAAVHLPGGTLPGEYIEGPPEIAVEVVSPNDSQRELEEKVQEYLDAGVRLVFVADPRRQTVTVYAPGHPAQVLRGDDVLSGQDVLPGFELRVGDLFRF